MSQSTGPPIWWQKMDEQMKQDSQRTARIVGQICGLGNSSPIALPGSKRPQGNPWKSRPRNRHRRKRRVIVIEESTYQVDAGGALPSNINSNSVRVSNHRSEWSKWIWLIVLFVIWPELPGYLYVGFILWVCYRTLYHYYAALDRLERR